MCNCIEKIERRMKADLIEQQVYAKEVVSVRMAGKRLSISDGLAIQTTSDFEIELDGQDERPSVSVAHSHCPFCGEDK